MKRSAPAALGNIWGMFSILYSLVILFVLIAPEEIGLFGIYSVFTQSILSHMNNINSFSTAGYVIAIGGFILSIIGLIGAGISRRQNILAGILLLVCSFSVFILYYVPFLFGANGVLLNMDVYINFGMREIVIISFLTIAVTFLGIIGGVLAFIPKKAPKQTFSGAGYGQQPYGQPPYGQQPPYQPIQPQPISPQPIQPQTVSQQPSIDRDTKPQAEDTE